MVRASSWIQQAADRTIEHAHRLGVKKIVCASGISPSGPIHLGNLREVMTTHFVAEEVRSRGYDAVHLHSWDDYDRFRKVPAGFDQKLAEHIGRPLSAVPDPCGRCDSYASHFIVEFSEALIALGVTMNEIRQSVQYRAGIYNAEIRQAMNRRSNVFDILSKFQTEKLHERPTKERRVAYYPFKSYCEKCGRDSTSVVEYDAITVRYECRCGYVGITDLSDGSPISGKLQWKVDWPMRWIHEQVVFEPAGEDHHAPSSSYASGRTLAQEIFGGTAPESFAYSFVGLAGGSSKMSGSGEGAALPASALDILEPAMVRWLYARRVPSQSFTIDLSPPAVQRLYDEWDRFGEQANSTHASELDVYLRQLCLYSSSGMVRHSRQPVSFRLLSSAADITQANVVQIQRIVRQHLGVDTAPTSPSLRDSLEPRLTCAVNFATNLLQPAERTTIRIDFNHDVWQNLDEATQTGVRMLNARLDGAWSLEGLTKLIYAIPKLLQGLTEDAPPSAELKQVQRAFFTVLYQLICSANTGPRLPTLMLSIGAARTHRLLSDPATASQCRDKHE